MRVPCGCCITSAESVLDLIRSFELWRRGYRLQRIKFFACTVWAFATKTMKHVSHVEWNSLHFSFPASMKRMLGDHSHSWPTTLFEKDVTYWSGNKIANCTFFGGEADPLLQISGAGMQIEDNLMEWNDWSAVTTRVCWPVGSTLPAASEPQLPGVNVTACDLTRKYGGGAFALIAPAGTITNPTIVSRNTLRHIGPSAGISINKNSMAELNHMYDEKDIQLDGSLVQGGAHDRYEVDNGQGKSVSEVDDEPTAKRPRRWRGGASWRTRISLS